MYADFTTPARKSIKLDAQGAIGDDSITYGANLGRGPGWDSPRKRTPSGGLGLGGLPRLAYLIGRDLLSVSFAFDSFERRIHFRTCLPDAALWRSRVFIHLVGLKSKFREKFVNHSGSRADTFSVIHM